MKVLNFKKFLKKHSWKIDTMNESQLQRVYNYPIYPRDSKLYSDKGFNNRQWISRWYSLDLSFYQRY